MPTKEIVCLAASRKNMQRCIAGRELSRGLVGLWIRPVSRAGHGEISWEQCRYANGGYPAVLDIMSVPLTQQAPLRYQSENWLIDDTQPWSRIGRCPQDAVPRMVGPALNLWIDGHASSAGVNDRIPDAEMGGVRDSLRFIRVADLEIFIRTYGPTRTVRCCFTYRRQRYNLKVTDPTVEATYRARPGDRWQIGDCYVAVSLGLPFNGFVYKLAAAIVPALGDDA